MARVDLRLRVTLPPPVIDAIDVIAVAHGGTRSTVVRDAVVADLSGRGLWPPIADRQPKPRKSRDAA